MTKAELETAIRDIMQDDEVVTAMLRCTTLPSVLKSAGEKAFLDELTGPSVETVREAMKMLRSPGWFEFQPNPEEDPRNR